jgi:hypothetical protein
MDDEISQGPERELRLPPRVRRILIAAAVAGLVAASAVFAVTRGGGHHASARGIHGAASRPAGSARPRPQLVIGKMLPDSSSAGQILVFWNTPAAASAFAAAPAVAAPGTVLMTCDTVTTGELGPDWRAGSLRVGPLWLVGGLRDGYARLGRARQPGRMTASGSATPRVFQIRVHVDAGSAVVMRPAAGMRSYFQFSDDPGDGSNQWLGGKGFTFVPCPAADRAGSVTGFYDVGYSLAPGRTASVEVWTSPSARPVWLTFTGPK